MILLAIDPGPEQSAYVLYDGHTLGDSGIIANEVLLKLLRGELMGTLFDDVDCMAVEWVASYGMPVGATVFETAANIGAFEEAFHPRLKPTRLYRSTVRWHLCHSHKAKDGNVRQALIDRFGGSRQKAIGTKKQPGPLYGVKKDIWSALAVAVTWWDTRKDKMNDR